ncbi:Tho2 and Thoc2 domain containing protein [Trichuris trichiura]|uniref:THO complex subunit 2 n=1 Tax=Trichuris trichiura TaxID=36087 RepID=A0A077ZF34_TRITR|nr:Tho2 and Thoc2 domain containing protein [Trichuris trichiura]
MLHEEPEGFVLLFSTLMNSSTINLSYGLDTRRVFDMILHCFQFHIEQYAFFVDLLRALDADAAMLNYIITLQNLCDATASSFFDVIAILVYHDLADLNFLLCNVSILQMVFVRYCYSISFRRCFLSLLPGNHKLRLLHSLIKIGHWTAAKVVLDHMPAHYSTRFTDANERKSEFENEISTLLDICCTTLLPSLTLISTNCSASEEMWLLLLYFSYEIRHTLYNEWANPGSTNPLLLEKRNEVLNQTRLSKETVKQSARIFGRLCHSYPVVVLDLVLNQVQQFENLVDPVVESMRYLTSLSYDVLSYCILTQLSNPDKQRLKLTDASISSWLQTLCSFTGSIFKKYYIDIECLLQYVCHQLLLDNSVDLLILYEVVKSMSGIEATSGVTTDQQLDAYSGGDLLKMEVMRCAYRSVLRLKQAIMQKDLIVNLCVRMAARRPRIVYSEAIMDVKVAGRMYDQCQDTLIQFASFLFLFVEPEEYVKRIPLVPELVEDCNLDIDVAMFLARPSYSHMIKVSWLLYFWSIAQIEFRKSTTGYLCYLCFSPKFFVLFWTLSTGDISVPNEMYKSSTDRLQNALSSREKAKYANHLAKMKEEHQRQSERVSLVKGRLAIDKDLHIPEFISSFIANCVYQRCVFSDVDAIFCHKFIEVLHFIKEFNFPTMAFYDMLFYDIAPLVLSFTEFEANRFGRFFASTFEMLLRWHVSQETYEKVNQAPCFHIGILWDTWLSYDNYRALLYTWQFRITRSMLTCLMEDSFISIATALANEAARIQDAQKNLRPDLSVLAARLVIRLMVSFQMFGITAAIFTLYLADLKKPSETKAAGRSKTQRNEDKGGEATADGAVSTSAE